MNGTLKRTARVRKAEMEEKEEVDGTESCRATQASKRKHTDHRTHGATDSTLDSTAQTEQHGRGKRESRKEGEMKHGSLADAGDTTVGRGDEAGHVGEVENAKWVSREVTREWSGAPRRV